MIQCAYFSAGFFHRKTAIGFFPQASTGSWGRGMTASGAPQNTDSIHRIVAAPGKTDRILPADAPVRPKPKLLNPLREGKVFQPDPAAVWPDTVLTQVVKKMTYEFLSTS